MIRAAGKTDHMEREVQIAVHDGGFHADDCFAAASFLLLLDKKPVVAKIIRTRDEAALARADFVADVGGAHDPAANRFDHHQPGGAGKRPGGASYASFGLVWKKFGAEIAGGGEAAARIDRTLVAPIDAQDNGEDIYRPLSPSLRPYLLTDFFQALEPSWREDRTKIDAAFLEAVALARRVLEREIAAASAALAAAAAVASAYESAPDKRVLALDDDLPWAEAVSALPEPLFVVSPRVLEGRGEWEAHAVRSDPASFLNRKDFPASWAGKRGPELAAASGVADAVFCHRGLFMAVARTKEGALALSKKTLDLDVVPGGAPR